MGFLFLDFQRDGISGGVEIGNIRSHFLNPKLICEKTTSLPSL